MAKIKKNKEISITKIVSFITIIFILGFVAGYFYKSAGLDNLRKYDGLRVGAKSYFDAKEITKKYDEYGDWVCVNVKGQSYERALEVCRHEVFHEIWAECGESNNLEYCINKYNEERKKNATI